MSQQSLWLFDLLANEFVLLCVSLRVCCVLLCVVFVLCERGGVQATPGGLRAVRSNPRGVELGNEVVARRRNVRPNTPTPGPAGSAAFDPSRTILVSLSVTRCHSHTLIGEGWGHRDTDKD